MPPKKKKRSENQESMEEDPSTPSAKQPSKKKAKKIEPATAAVPGSKVISRFGSTTVPALNVDAWSHGGVCDLGFLKPLRDDISGFFMPDSLWVRQEMIDTMQELQENSKAFKRQVLIGSPGVGKSVLFFLYALLHAQNTGKKVMYWRKATADQTKINLFCIEALGDKVEIRWNKVSIPFRHSINDIHIQWMLQAYPDLFMGLNLQDEIVFEGHATDLLINQVTMFVDGPKQKDKQDTLDGSVAFLCSSGGYPLPFNDQNTVLTVLVLCGWGKDPFLKCIEHYAKDERVVAIWTEQIGLDNNDGTDVQEYPLQDKKTDVAELIYYYTGGRIRDGLKLLEGALSFQKFRTDAGKLIRGIPAGAVELAATSTYGTKDPKSSDSLRTYFKIESETEGAQHVQLVDSEYCLKLLSDRDMAEKYLAAYKEAVKLKDMTVAGQQFERMMHKVFMKLAEENDDVPFDGHIQTSGSTKEDVTQIRKDKYWMPSVPNFPGIDAAVWSHDSIYNLQYFAGKRHGFKARTFKTTFLNHIPDNAGEIAHRDGKCFITYVTPSDQRDQTPEAIPQYHWRKVVINVESIETVKASAPNAFMPGIAYEAPTRGGN